MHRSRNSASPGISTSIRSLDSVLGGLHPSDLIVLAARPGVGKSALVTQIAYEVAKTGRTVGIFSLEMSAEQLSERLVCGISGVDAHRLRVRRLRDDEWDEAFRVMAQISPYPIYVDTSPVLTPSQALSRARRLKNKDRLDLIIVDYLQLMSVDGKRESRQQEIAEISRVLKGLARDLKVPVLACSQLSRAVEQRKSKEPELSDLRESGAIEQDADIVMFLHRLEHDPKAATYETDVLVKKHRHGPVGKCTLTFVPSRVRFELLSRRGE